MMSLLPGVGGREAETIGTCWGSVDNFQVIFLPCLGTYGGYFSAFFPRFFRSFSPISLYLFFNLLFFFFFPCEHDIARYANVR